MVKKILRHAILWNKWRKNCLNSKFHKVMVLLGNHSPTFEWEKAFGEPIDQAENDIDE